jgi:hypothetical protein
MQRGGLLAAPLVLFALICALLAWAPTAGATTIPWCGSGEPSTDLPDAVSAFEWHIIYAIPTDGQDRFGYFAPRIAGDAAAVSNWWVSQDPTRRPRYDLIDAPGCPSEPQRVDITVARLPHPNAAESSIQIQADLRALGFASIDKAYLVYYDGSLNVSSDYGTCGQGGVANGPWAYTVIYLQTCFQSINDDYRAVTAAHEMVHGMGAVDSDAPHYCNSGHVCDSPDDLMKAIVSNGETLSGTTLDVGRDDYYGHSGTWYDVQDNGLLYRLDLNLAPTPAVTATATNIGGAVHVSWKAARADSGLNYRVYGADGQAIQTNGTTELNVFSSIGETLTWTIRAEDDGGFLGPATTLAFKVGYGIVDGSGTVTKDTVPPGDVGTLRQSRSGKTLVIRWAPVADPIGVRYRVMAPGLSQIVKSATARLPLAKVHGKKITVVAVDGAGNMGHPVTIVARS